GRHVTFAAEVVSDLARLGSCPVGELPRPADISDLLRQAVQSERGRAQRHDIQLALEVAANAGATPAPPGSTEDMLEVGSISVLFQVLVDHAIEASPGGSTVTIHLEETPNAYQVTFDDSGPSLPPSARGSVLSRDFDAIAHGRPPGLALIAASTIAA